MEWENYDFEGSNVNLESFVVSARRLFRYIDFWSFLKKTMACETFVLHQCRNFSSLLIHVYYTIYICIPATDY